MGDLLELVTRITSQCAGFQVGFSIFWNKVNVRLKVWLLLNKLTQAKTFHALHQQTDCPIRGTQQTMHSDNGAHLMQFVWPGRFLLGVVRSFEIFPGVVVPPGTYDHREAQLVFFTSESAPLSGRIQVVSGGWFGGDRLQINPSGRLRVGEALNVNLSLSRNRLDLPGGSFVTNLASARISYSFSARVYVQSLVQ